MCRGGSRAAFFYPVDHGGTRHTKRAGQAAQTAAFLIRAQDGVAFRRRVAIRLGVFTVLSTTRATHKPLLSRRRMAVFHQRGTVAERTCSWNHALPPDTAEQPQFILS